MIEKMILLVEDNVKVQTFNRELLKRQGFAVETVMTLADARSYFQEKSRRPSAVVLDIGMPDGSGLDFLRELRERGDKTPVLLLTGYGKDDDIKFGFDAGCDDYLPKPYTFGVLLARLKRLLQSAEQVPERVTHGVLTIDILSGQALLHGKDLFLSQKEFTLLLMFTQNEGQVIGIERLYEKVWGQSLNNNTGALTNMIYRLRKKIKGSGYDIVAERGQGYCFELE